MPEPVQESAIPSLASWLERQLEHYSLFDALRGRRSRRFGVGMKIGDGPFTYASQHPPQSLTEDEEALLAFAACGITGSALADLSYGRGQGGHMLGGLVGRTVSSPDAINTVSVIVTNDDATYLLKRPQDLAASEVAELIRLSDARKLIDVYRQMRVKIRDSRTEIPVEPGLNFNINKWSVYAKGGSYFLPVNEMTAVYINALLESFDPAMGLFLFDERNWYQPAGIGKFAKSKGGPLDDNLKGGHVGTVQAIEFSLAEAVAVEQGMILQNLGLMTQAIGLGGFANYARNEYAWLQALGFRMETMIASRYVGANAFLTFILSLMGRNYPFPYAIGLEQNGSPLLHAYCPPYYPTMADAVRAYVDHKFGAKGIWTEGSGAWKAPGTVTQHIDPPSETAIQATIAYCEYIYRRYGRFPAYSAPFRTVIGYQATHIDVDFYDQFFHPDALTQTQREHHALHTQGGTNNGHGSR